MLENKKGQLLLPIAGIVLVAILLLLFVFSPQYKFLFIGIAFSAGTIWAIGKGMTSPNGFNKANTSIVLVLLAVSLIFIFGSNLVQQAVYTGSSSDFVKPIWGRLECKTNSVPVTSAVITTQQSGSWIDCTENTPSCNILLAGSVNNWYNSNDIIINWETCKIGDSSTCTTKQHRVFQRGTASEIITSIPQGYTAFVYGEGTVLHLNQIISVQKSFNLFQLVYDYGGADVVNSANCEIKGTSKSGDSILNTLLSNTKSAQGINCVDFINRGDWCNMVVDWVYGPGTGVVTHPTYGQVYCSGTNLYKIIQVTTEGGVIKKLDPTYKSADNTGKAYSGLGDFVAKVQCCPGTASCGSNFQLTNGAGTCVSDINCRNGGAFFSYSATQKVQEKCVSGTCTLQKPATVECGTNTACNPGQVCDKLSWTCTNIGVGSNEGTQNLSQAKCQWYQDPVTINTYKTFLGIQYGTPSQSPGCQTAGWIYGAEIAGVILILGVVLIIVNKPAVKSNKKKL